jgi:hypothetical protein
MNKKINLSLAVLGIGLLCGFVGPAQAQPNAMENSKVRASQKQSKEAPGSYKHTVAALRLIADTIKACPRIVEFDASKDSQQSDGPLARSRLYYGPPVNVVWDVDRSNSIRSPYQGYIQFSVPRELWIPPDVRKRWANEAAELYAEMLQPMPPLEYRYEFALGPDGLQLIGILFRSADDSEWKDAPEGEKACSSPGCVPACWRSAAQPKQALSDARKR